MRGSRQLAWLGVCFVGVLSGTLAQQTADKWTAQLPEGQGKALLIDACVQCHTLESTVVQRKDRMGWQKTVNDMILRGAFLTPAEAETIVAYLSKVLGPGQVELNHASLDELLRGTPLERAEAEAILRYRNRYGPFRSVEDLKKVKELRPERFDKVKGHLTVLPVSPPRSSKSKPN